ncbi:hypothetical protein CR513_23974, partial [Mucuna pruriens]
MDDELLQTFRKVEIDIPLLDVIKQIPKYAKFHKELCTHKRKKLKGDIEMIRNVSTLIKSQQVFALIQPTMLKKCRDLDICTVPCTIGECTLTNAMLDLGASINVMPSLVYISLKLGDLEPNGVIIQLENRSIAYPLDILEDVLVQDESSSKESTLIVNKPFLMTTRTKIDVHDKTLSMEFGDNMI